MDTLASALLRRCRVVALPAGVQPEAAGRSAGAGEDWVRSLETDLAGRGWLLSSRLRAAFARLDPAARLGWADWLLAAADESVGADRVHAPLFRSFPDVPESLDSLYVELLLAGLFQTPDAPCVLCGAVDAVRPLDPCGHLICAACFTAERFTGCPVCGRRITGDGFLAAPRPDPAAAGARARTADPIRWTRIDLVSDAHPQAVTARDELIARPQPLSEQDAADFAVFVAATAAGRLDWLPDDVPVRQNLARALALALAGVRPDTAEALVPELLRRWTTTTDIARTLWAYSGGDPGLTLPSPTDPAREALSHRGSAVRPLHEPVVFERADRVRAIPRWLRRTVLAKLDSFDLPTVGEDLARHPTVWKRLAERLHPFEYAAQYPRAAVSFAALRGTRTPVDGALGLAMQDAVVTHPAAVRLTIHPGDLVSVRIVTHSSRVEQALAAGDPGSAIDLLAQRPGLLWRRLDHLARAVGDDPGLQARLVDAAREAARRVAPGILTTATHHLAQRPVTVRASQDAVAERMVALKAAAARTAAMRRTLLEAMGVTGHGAALLRTTRDRGPVTQRPQAPAPGAPRRIFQPRGDTVRIWTELERRDPLPQPLVDGLVAAGRDELVRRARTLPPYDIVLADAGLASVPAPSREQASSGQLAGWTRGTRVALPQHDGTLRLFLHWTDTDSSRVDLDLSCVAYGDDWTSLGHCDYTSLRWRGMTHSGDLTSAPLPGGATEYIDLDLARVREAGARWVVPVVFSYSDVPFEHLDRAFAGFMLPMSGGEAFQPDRVAQRFDLRGRSRTLVPLVVDLGTGTLLWTDVHLSSVGYGHSVGKAGDSLGRLAADMWEYYLSLERVSLFDLVVLHALGRAPWLRIVRTDGSISDVDLDRPAGDAIRLARLAVEAGHTTTGGPEVAGSALVAAVQAADVQRVAEAVTAERVMSVVAIPAGAGDLSPTDLIADLRAPGTGPPTVE